MGYMNGGREEHTNRPQDDAYGVTWVITRFSDISSMISRLAFRK